MEFIVDGVVSEAIVASEFLVGRGRWKLRGWHS